jgi:hypothetical protein
MVFLKTPLRTETRDGFQVVLEYEDDPPDLALVDLSHRAKWDLQAADLDGRRPFGIQTPARPGRVSVVDGLLVMRLNQTQAAVWHLGPEPVSPPSKPEFTEITDGRALVAILGRGAFDLMSRLTRLELKTPGVRPPYVIQGPILDVPGRIVVLDHGDESPAVLLSWARGWGQALVGEIMARGAEPGLSPGGEGVFSAWLDSRASSLTAGTEVI